MIITSCHQILLLDYKIHIQIQHGQCLTRYGMKFNVVMNITAPTDMHPDDFTNPRAAFWVAMVQDTPAGSIGLMPLSQDIADLNAMYVSPEFRGAGIAQGLMQALEEHARQHCFTVIRLRAGSQQPEAVRFYEKMGFNRIPCFGKYAESSNSWCFEKQL
ncbi:MAG: GNAT family N-acetyltransferase [Gloeocapsa sp. UFS-A4-WI-NPMV-4B04]|jgi:putative acetyltransferase|nr:GNAT family N-acetyltransferase [Gloeocapsa sp. UFS-A4-WI-NPMV-4B04]